MARTLGRRARCICLPGRTRTTLILRLAGFIRPTIHYRPLRFSLVKRNENIAHLSVDGRYALVLTYKVHTGGSIGIARVQYSVTNAHVRLLAAKPAKFSV